MCSSRLDLGCLSSESCLVHQDVRLLSRMIGKVNFKHCLRYANQAAHVLGNFSYCNKTSNSWSEEAPAYLVSIIVDDVIPFIDQ